MPLMLLCLAAVSVRVFAATYGANYDVNEAWRLVARELNEGRRIYPDTPYAYGPPWAYVCWGAFRLARYFDTPTVATAHWILAGIAGCADAATIVWLRRQAGWVSAILFACAPVSILVTGFHTQVDEISIPFMLYGLTWLQRPQWYAVAVAGMLMGMSLLVKHDWIYYPVWLCVAMVGWRTAACAALSYGVFLGCLWVYPGAWNMVLGWHGGAWTGNGAIAMLMRAHPPWWVWGMHGGMLLGAVMMRWIPDGSSVYPFWMTVCSPMICDQYLVLPTWAAVRNWRSVAVWPFVVVSTLVLCGSMNNIGMVVHWIGRIGEGWALMPLGHWNRASVAIQAVSVVAIIGLVLDGRWRKRRTTEVTAPPRTAIICTNVPGVEVSSVCAWRCSEPRSADAHPGRRVPVKRLFAAR